MITRRDLESGDKVVANCVHWSDTKKEAGLAKFLSRLPRETALHYWLPERNCQKAQVSTIAASEQTSAEQAVSVQCGMSTIDRATVALAHKFISAGRATHPETIRHDRSNVVEATSCPTDQASPINNMLVEDPMDTRGFVRFVEKVENKNPGAIRKWLSGKSVNCPTPIPQSESEDFWFLLEDKYEDILDLTGGDEVEASRRYLKALVKSVPTLMTNRKRTLQQKRSRER